MLVSIKNINKYQKVSIVSGTFVSDSEKYLFMACIEPFGAAERGNFDYSLVTKVSIFHCDGKSGNENLTRDYTEIPLDKNNKFASALVGFLSGRPTIDVKKSRVIFRSSDGYYVVATYPYVAWPCGMIDVHTQGSDCDFLNIDAELFSTVGDELTDNEELVIKCIRESAYE